MKMHSFCHHTCLALALSILCLSGGCSSVKKFFNEPPPAKKASDKAPANKQKSDNLHSLLLENSQLNDVERRELEKILPSEKDRKARQKEIFGF